MRNRKEGTRWDGLRNRWSHSDCWARWPLHRRRLWLKACTLKDMASELMSVGRTTGIIEAIATTTLGIGVAATAGLSPSSEMMGVSAESDAAINSAESDAAINSSEQVGDGEYGAAHIARPFPSAAQLW